jgi:hypothetical protein
MALSPQLQQFKSSGVYRLEFDKSQTISIPAETIRLVVGHSKIGPYNIPIFIQDVETFIQVFGSIDKNLERRGMFFHRSAIETLTRGPILALNLTSANDADQIDWVSLTTNGSEQGTPAIEDSALYKDLFNRDKFWIPEDQKLLNLAENTSAISNNALTFTNIKQDPITVVVRQAEDTRGFNVTALEWYGAGNVPTGVNGLDYISDYMIDVYVFKGRFVTSELNNDPTFGNYFNSNGIIPSQFNKFINLREVSLIAKYTGSLIPDFQDNEGRQYYIETLINAESRRTGLFCAVNEEAIDKIDFVGEAFDIYQDYELLSHIIVQSQPVQLNSPRNLAFENIVEVNGDTMIIKNVTEAKYLDMVNRGLVQGNFLYAYVSGEYTEIETVSITDPTWSGSPAIQDVTVVCVDDISKSQYEAFVAETNPADYGSTSFMGDDLILNYNGTFNAGDLAPGKYLPSANAGEYVEILDVNDDGSSQVTIVPSSGQFSTTLLDGGPGTLTVYDKTNQIAFDLFEIQKNKRTVFFPTNVGSGNPGWSFAYSGPSSAGKFTWTYVAAAGTDVESILEYKIIKDIKVGMYVPSDEFGKLARIKEIRKIVTLGTGGADDKYEYTFICHRNVSTAPLYALGSFESASDAYKPFVLNGAENRDKTIGELLTVLIPGGGVSNTLIDKDAITYRYLVDTFGSYEPASGLLNKFQFTQLAKARQNVSAILNAPMVKEFKESTNPSFTDENTGEFSTRYIATGGNLNLNPQSLYTLPSINDGASYGFYFSPGMNVVENGRTKVIPPAAYVSNNFIDKYTDSLPWSIVAGPRRGVVSGTGVQNVEFAFDKDDRDVLEPFGINPIIFERGVGITIKGNKTAQQSVKSALSSAHVREVLIYIEDGLAEILKNYLFEFNTAQTRLEIKTLADSFMESVRKDQGIYDYRNIMDTTNNTNEVIDNNMGILDTYVEPVKGLEILVSRVTVLNTGDIESGNFA